MNTVKSNIKLSSIPTVKNKGRKKCKNLVAISLPLCSVPTHTTMKMVFWNVKVCNVVDINTDNTQEPAAPIIQIHECTLMGAFAIWTHPQ
jgi:hypothetical protein